MCVLWGTTYLAIRIGVATWEPFLFGGLRFAAAGTIVILAMRLRGSRVPRDARTLRDAAITGTLLLVGGNAAVIIAEQYVPSGITAVMVSTMPIWTVVIGTVSPRGHRLTRLNWVGLIAGLVGVVVLAWPEFAGPLPANREFLRGVVLLQLGSISWAVGSIYVVTRRANVPPLLRAGLQMLAGGIVMILLGSLLGEWTHSVPPLCAARRSRPSTRWIVPVTKLLPSSERMRISLASGVLPERDGDGRLAPPGSANSERDLLAGLEVGERHRDVVDALDRLPCDRRDRVARRKSGFCRRPVGSHRGDEHAPARAEGGELDTEVGAVRLHDAAIADELTRDRLHGVAWDGEADAARLLLILGIDSGQGRDADDLPAEIDKRPTAVSGVDRRIGLDHRLIGDAGQQAIEAAHDPARHGLLYAATQHGVYLSYDDGTTWQSLSLNLPDGPGADLIVDVAAVVRQLYDRRADQRVVEREPVGHLVDVRELRRQQYRPADQRRDLRP